MAFMGELQQGAIGADGDDPQGDRLAASSQSSVGGVLQPAAAGDLHAQQGDALDGIGRENGGELFGVVVGIQLGTADEGDAPLHEVPVEISIGVGGAIGGDQQLGTVKRRCINRCKLDLYRPLLQTGHCGSKSCIDCLACLECRFIRLYCGFIIRCCFSLDEGNGIGRTGWQTISQTIAIIIPHESGFAIHHANSAFMTG